MSSVIPPFCLILAKYALTRQLYQTMSVLLYQSHRVHELLLPLTQARAEHHAVLELPIDATEVLKSQFLCKNCIEDLLIFTVPSLIAFGVYGVHSSLTC